MNLSFSDSILFRLLFHYLILSSSSFINTLRGSYVIDTFWDILLLLSPVSFLFKDKISFYPDTGFAGGGLYLDNGAAFNKIWEKEGKLLENKSKTKTNHWQREDPEGTKLTRF